MSTIQATDVFGQAISTEGPQSVFEQKAGAVKLPGGISNDSPIETNSFYTNMMTDGEQTNQVFCQPYSVAYSNDTYFGLSAYHAQAKDRVFASGSPPSYFYHPTGIKELVFSSTEFDSKVLFSLTNAGRLSATAKFSSSDKKYLEAPLAEGMGFVTAVYHDLIPQINSAVGFVSVDGQTSPKNGINKYTIKLNNQTTWSLFVSLPEGQSLDLKLKDSNTIIGDQSVDGAIFQVGFGEDSAYDQAAGCYPTDVSVSGSVSNSTFNYKINYATEGSSNSGTTLIFALPHHKSSFDDATKKSATSFKIDSTTKGKMVGCLTNTLSMNETINSKISFDPFTTISGKSPNYSENALSAIKSAAAKEVEGDVENESNSDSMYTAGKVLSKYATVLYTCRFILKDDGLTNTLLPKLKKSFEKFAQNKQNYPLIYDTTCKGVVTSAPTDSDYGANTYNDHHFHYGYHLHALALTAKVDSDMGGSWVNDYKSWGNSLARDIANPTTSDSYFPVFRCFDFFLGHLWAAGMTSAGDGKNEELTSEDVHHVLALRLWGSIIGDSNLENRSLLMLSILRRSLDLYFYLKDNNTVQPSQFIPNKVAGITFDNKLDYTTYFGANTEYIHGIHMLPISAASSFVRRPSYVKEEWDSKLSSIIDSVDDGWKGILMLNVALFDPDAAYKFFSSSNFSSKHLDNGMSLTWSLAYCAGVGASS